VSQAEHYQSELDWLLNSPEIFQHHSTDSLQLNSRYLDEIQIANSAFEAPDIQPRLGLYAESLLANWMKSHPYLNLLACNKQIFNKDKQTIGAFDFLVHDSQHDLWWHWELTVKYYLLHQTNDSHQWIGPDRRDTLTRKYKHLLTRQIRLSDTPEGKQYLAQWHTGEWQKAIIARGYLFYPRAQWLKQDFISDNTLNPEHNKAWWLHAKDITELENENTYWLIRKKPDWLIPALKNNDSEIQNSKEIVSMLKQHFENSVRAIMLSQLEKTPSGQYTEISRAIIVPDNWPEIAT